MGNPFYRPGGGQHGPFSNMQNMLQMFRQFRNGYTGDARQEVQNLLSSGRMSQQQFNQLAQFAQQFQNIFK